MNKPALPHEILMRIEKPGRYTGGEINAVYKDLSEVDIRFAFAFPDTYEVGMSNLGVQILYAQFNSFPGVWCERVYSPWLDLDRIMREKNIPLFAWESQEPVKNFDFLGFSLQYEMCYTNVLQILELSGIPLYAKDRGEDDPLVIGGGSCAYNPEPVADFFDLFYIGEGEISYKELFETFRECRKQGLSRKEFLRRAASIEGIYVPSLYEVTYHEEDTIQSFLPVLPGVPEKVKKTIVSDFETAPYPLKPVIPFVQAVMDRMVLEIQRGCIRGCRFCQAGYIYRPLRERPLDDMLEMVRELIQNTGYDEISLNSLSSSDYDHLPELLDQLIRICGDKKINISLPSLRIDAFSIDVMNRIQDVKKSSLTFAPEAGSQRMRDVINKNLTEEQILTGAHEAFRGGWNKVKLYFMLGLPGETEEDVREIARLCERIAENYYDIPKDQRNGKVTITPSTSFFVPKPFTAFQWAKMDRPESFLHKASLVKEEIANQLNRRSMQYKYHDAELSILEGIFARGDRRLSKLVESAYRHGALFDSWTDAFNREAWKTAFEECGIDEDFYLYREREDDELFPWDFIDIGVSKKFLLTEWKRSRQEVTTPNCREKCMGCGARNFGCGVCFEKEQPV